jgi:alpha-glucoside transport system substrate-binding protein
MDELLKVTDELKGKGETPWCIAAESGAATGWPITDWIEDLVLRTAGPEGYDKWVKGELKFNSPEVKAAFDYFHTIAFTEGNVLGGTKAIASTNFQTGGNALFKQPPGCYLFKQATFIAGKGGFPDNVLAKLDTTVGVAAFPPKEAGNNPVLVGGDLAAAFNGDKPTPSSCATSSPAKTTASRWARPATSARTRPSTSTSTRARPSRRSPPKSSTSPRPPASTGPT